MGKGQKLRREQEAAATASVGSMKANTTPAVQFPTAPKPIVLAASPPPKPPAPFSPTPSLPNVVSTAASGYMSMFQETDGIEIFLALDEVERLNRVEELLEQARIAHTPSPQPSMDTKVISSLSSLKTSQSMQSLSSNLSSMKFGSSNNQQDSVKHARSSNSLQDLNKSSLRSEKTDTSLIESIVLDLTVVLKGCGVSSLEGHRILLAMQDQIASEDKIEKGLILMKSLLTILDRIVEPFVFPSIARLLNLHADRSPIVRSLAAEILDVLASTICPYSIFVVYEILEPCMKDDIDWRIKVAALQLLKSMSPRVSGIISSLLPRMIPQVRFPLLSHCYDALRAFFV